MARNKYPEVTVARILDAAEELFGQKGYDATSIQDIVDGLDGLTKGAIYHHFKSKEDILDAVLLRVIGRVDEQLDQAHGDTELSGVDQVAASVDPQNMGAQARVWHRMMPAPDPVRHARLLGMQFKSTFELSAREYLQPAIERGNRDGSLACEHPREAAEALAILEDLWLVPLFGPYEGAEATRARFECFWKMAAALGIELDRDAIDVAADEVVRIYEGEE